MIFYFLKYKENDNNQLVISYLKLKKQFNYVVVI